MRGRLLALLMLVLALPVQAHKASDSFVAITVEGAAVNVRWDIALRDLDPLIGLDGDGDGAITWGELRAQEAALAAHALSRLAVFADDDAPCPLSAAPGLAVADHSDGRHAVLRLSGRCPQSPARIAIDYALLFDLDAQHRGLLRLDFAGRSESGVFAPDRRRLVFDAGAPSRVFSSHFREGLWHVWLGADHMLFLAGLFLPALLRRGRTGWQAATRLGPALRETAVLVTAFTAAHAMTLALAASGVLVLPSRLVESLVAASVLFAGLNILVPIVERRLVWLAAGFGLIHGAAIAGALLELGLPTSGRVLALLGFNLGVELAQLALIAIVVPVAYRFRNAPAFRDAVLIPSALVIALAGLGWLLQRALQWPVPMPF